MADVAQADGATLREQVREHYAAAARAVAGRTADEHGPQGCGCGADGAVCCDGSSTDMWGSGRYDEAVRAEAPDVALLASLGCGNPTAVAELRPGETVLDLGAGGGLDVILSARRVGPEGKAYGLDMTEDMLALALQNKAKAGLSNVEFLKGYIEEVPLAAETVDVVISNCVINLSANKPRVFAEAFRVLRPGGRFAVTDVVSDLPQGERSGDPALWSGCIAGALTRRDYRDGLESAGFAEVAIEDSHRVAEGFASAIIRARKPSISEIGTRGGHRTGKTEPLERPRPASLTVLSPNCC